jgi:hypothetical protein
MESKLSLLGAMKEKVTLRTQELNSLVLPPSTIGSPSSLSFDERSSTIISFENLDHYVPLKIDHMSHNNASQPAKQRKRNGGTSRLRDLLRRHSTTAKTITPLKQQLIKMNIDGEDTLARCPGGTEI